MTKAAEGSALIGEDRQFQERFWGVQRGVWIIFALIMIVSMLGLAGSGGPLGHVETRSGAASIRYPRTMHWRSSDELEVQHGSQSDGVVSLTLSPDFLKSFDIGQITPEPGQAGTSAGGTRFLIQAQPNRQGDVRIRLKPTKPFALVRGRVGVGDGPMAPVNLLILP